MRFDNVIRRRYYKSHFTDSMRQCCLDLMQGAKIHESDIQNFWSYLRVIGNITGEIIPTGSVEPVHIPQLALTQEFELANALYYMCRSVQARNEKPLLKTYSFLHPFND